MKGIFSFFLLVLLGSLITLLYTVWKHDQESSVFDELSYLCKDAYYKDACIEMERESWRG